MFVVTVVSMDGETSAKAFEAMSNARKWASAGALNEFDGDVAGVTIHEAVTNTPRHPITAEQADRVAKAEAIRFLAKLGLKSTRN
jgi:hypothetical protein